MSAPATGTGDDVAGAGAFGRGVLARAAVRVHTLMAVGVCFVVAVLPGLVGSTLLVHDASNVPLLALCALPVGPALVAAVAGVARRRDIADLHPVADFVRDYRAGAVQGLQLWGVALVALTVLGVDLAHLSAAGVPGWWRWALVALGSGVLTWVQLALVLCARFSFRTRDLARLAVLCAVRRPRAGTGALALVVCAGAALLGVSEAVLALAGALYAAVLSWTCDDAVTMITKEFTA